MKYYLFVFFLFYSFLVFADYRILSTNFDKDYYYIGDNIDCLIKIETQNRVSEKIIIPELSWGAIKSMKVSLEKENIYNIQLDLVPYDVGLLTIPKIDMGSFQIKEINIFVDSLLKNGNDKLEPIRKPLLLPGSNIIFASFIGIVLFLLVFFVFFFEIAQKSFFEFLHKAKEDRIKSKFLKYVYEYSYKSTIETKVIYSEILDFIRYFSNIFLYIKNDYMTANELKEDIKNKYKGDVYNDLFYLIDKSKNISFSNFQLNEEEIVKDIFIFKNTIEKIIDSHFDNKGSI